MAFPLVEPAPEVAGAFRRFSEFDGGMSAIARLDSAQGDRTCSTAPYNVLTLHFGDRPAFRVAEK
jgi:hypothetical protein